MAGGGVNIHIDTADVVRRIRGFGRRARNISMGPVAAILSTYVDDVFQAEGAVGGNKKWDPLAQSTLDRHPRRSGGQILQDTGLMANIQTSTTAETATATSPAPYAGAHVEGNSHLPVRDPFQVDQTAMLNEVDTWILGELARG